MEVFIDESGTLGAKDRYFVIAMLFASKKKRIVNFIKRFIGENNLDEVHAASLSFPQKQDLIKKLVQLPDNYISYIVVDKNYLDSKLFANKNLCFNYIFGCLMKRHIVNCNEEIRVLLDQHSVRVKSMNSLGDYISIKAFTEWGFKHDIYIHTVDSRDSKLVQATDLAANAIYAKYNYGKTHLYNMLKIKESIKFPYKKFGA